MGGLYLAIGRCEINARAPSRKSEGPAGTAMLGLQSIDIPGKGGKDMRIPIVAAGLLVALLAVPAFAQAPQGTPQNVRGKIVNLSGQSLSVKTREGQTVTVALAPGASVLALARKKLSDIKSGDFIASTSMRGKDGKLHAVEIHFLPPNVPELQIPYDLRQGSVMTNSHVSGIAKVTGGTDLAVTYKGTSTDIIVDSKTSIVGPVPAAMDDLKPGKAVFLRAVKAADGSLSANNVTVEKPGVKPPM
jgi:hypothetical protein